MTSSAITENIEDMPISRRDFLKVTGLTIAALVGRQVIQSVAASEQNVDRFPTIETPEAAYYPLYEMHDVGLDIPAELARRPALPSAHFNEFSLGSGKDKIMGAQEFLSYAKPMAYLTASRENDGVGIGRMFSDSTLAYFSRNNISVALEGIFLPTVPDFQEPTVLAQTRYNATGFLAGIAERLPRWFLKDDMKNALWGIRAQLTQLQPENLIVYFRNLVFARKIQTLAEYFVNPGHDKPTVSSLLGFDHLGVNSFLAVGENITIEGFSVYPKEVLRKIVAANGGIEPFCTTLVIPVRSNLAGVPIRQFAIDIQLKQYLQGRL